MMKKIAIVRYCLSKVGGAEKVAINMANELSKKYDTRLISILLEEEKKINFNLNPDVTFVHLATGNIRIRTTIRKYTLKLRKYLKDENIELVFSIAPLTNIMVKLATVGLDVKIVFCDHHSLEFQDGMSRKIQRYIGAKYFDKIITLTEEDKIKYPQKYKIDSSKVDYIYNWMDAIEGVEGYNIKSKRLITVGRFHSQKGYDYLSKVAIKVLSRYPDWQWDIYGSGDEQIKQDLITELDKGGVLSRVHFKGNVKGTDNIYPDHAIYVMTSRYEGLPLVLLEAKQYGLPIVSFNCPTGPAEIVLDEENGYLIENFDINQMSQKIIELIENNELRLGFSQNAMLDTDKFNKKRITERWIELIEKMAGE